MNDSQQLLNSYREGKTYKNDKVVIPGEGPPRASHEPMQPLALLRIDISTVRSEKQSFFLIRISLILPSLHSTRACHFKYIHMVDCCTAWFSPPVHQYAGDKALFWGDLETGASYRTVEEQQQCC